jgi:DNA polymerase-3 subunit beta
MEFTIDRSLFLEGLEKTLSVVEKRNTMPSLNHALLDIKEDQLQISATDLEIFVSASVPCKVTTSGRIALPAKNLYDIVKELQANEVKIRGLENNRVEIKSGKSLFRLMGLSADDFPHFKTSPKRGTAKLAKYPIRTAKKVFVMEGLYPSGSMISFHLSALSK